MIPGMAAVKYDVCVIGSGAAGGVMTKQLCEAGAKVVLLEAGPRGQAGRVPFALHAL